MIEENWSELHNKYGSVLKVRQVPKVRQFLS